MGRLEIQPAIHDLSIMVVYRTHVQNLQPFKIISNVQQLMIAAAKDAILRCDEILERPEKIVKPDQKSPTNGLCNVAVNDCRQPSRNHGAVEFVTLEWVDYFHHCPPQEPIGDIPPAAGRGTYHALNALAPRRTDLNENASAKPGAI